MVNTVEEGGDDTEDIDYSSWRGSGASKQADTTAKASSGLEGSSSLFDSLIGVSNALIRQNPNFYFVLAISINSENVAW